MSSALMSEGAVTYVAPTAYTAPSDINADDIYAGGKQGSSNQLLADFGEPDADTTYFLQAWRIVLEGGQGWGLQGTWAS